MNRIAFINLTKYTVKQYNSKIILNQNVAIYGNDCRFKGILFNPKNIYFMNYTDGFVKTNLIKFVAPRMYFTNMFFDYDIYLKLQNILNSNLNYNIYVNKNQYDKFLRRMENSTKYLTGVSYDNSIQILPFDFKDMHSEYEEIALCNKSYKRI